MDEQAANERAAEFERVVRGDDAPDTEARPRSTGSRLDEAWQRWMSDPRTQRVWTIGAPAAVLAIAAATRLIGLDHPHQIVFDETYYVKDAYTLSQLGYEAKWPDDANDSFASGNPDVYTSDPSFVVHPPLGKWIIAAGMAVFGADNAFGWRIGIAALGILLVAVTMLVAHRLFARTSLTVLAGALIAIDGNAIVMSRVSLLDTGVAFFALLGAYFVLRDRGTASRHLDTWVAEHLATGQRMIGGPRLWARPWLLAAALAFGCAASVKWNGFFFLAVFGIYTVVSDALLRRRAGVELWGTGTVLRQAPVNFVLLVPLAFVVYVASWWGWFATDGGYYRHWAETVGTPWAGALEWVPLTVQNWWHYQTAIYGFNVGLSTEHPYMANPLGWLFLIRPTSMFYRDLGNGTAEAILDVANPLIWWAGTAALGFLVVRTILRLRRGERVWADAFILTGLAAGYLPWLAYLNRTVFQFYTIVFEPYLVLALTAALAAIAGRRSDARDRRTTGLVAVGVFLGLVVLVSMFFWPMWSGIPQPTWFLRLHYWLGNAWI